MSERMVVGITAPGVPEIIIMLAVLLLLIGIVWLVVRAARPKRGKAPDHTEQQPPSGYWWDGQKWNPPGERGPTGSG